MKLLINVYLLQLSQVLIAIVSRFVNKSEVLEYVEKEQLPISLGGTVSKIMCF